MGMVLGGAFGCCIAIAVLLICNVEGSVIPLLLGFGLGGLGAILGRTL